MEEQTDREEDRQREGKRDRERERQRGRERSHTYIHTEIVCIHAMTYCGGQTTTLEVGSLFHLFMDPQGLNLGNQ